MKNFILMVLFTFSVIFASEPVGEKFRDFHGKDESGKDVKLSDLVQKTKPVVVIFWAIGDVDTYSFLPKLNPIYDQYKDKAVFVAPLLSRSNLQEVKHAKSMIPLNMPVWLASSDSIRAYGIDKIDVPYIVFISKDGKITKIIKTARDVKEVETNIKRLLRDE